MRPQSFFVSATTGPWELEHTGSTFTEQLVPTGLIDPLIIVRPTATQVDDVMAECRELAAKGQRVRQLHTDGIGERELRVCDEKGSE